MLTIYLDQNKWIDLAKAYHNRPDGLQFKDVLDLSAFAVKHQVASFPLSSVHYLETWKVSDPGRRQRLGEVMGEISHFDTIAVLREVINLELDRALSRFFGSRRKVEDVSIFGRGFSHAFGKDFPLDIPRPPEIPQFIYDESLFEVWKIRESWVLGGYRPTEEFPDLDTSTYTKYPEEFKAAESEIAEMMRSAGTSKADRENVALVRSIFELWQFISLVLNRSEITLDMFLSLGITGLREFLEHVPSRYVTYEMQRLRYENLNLPRHIGDLMDLGALSCAVAYCNVVVTERHWTHLIERSGIGKRYDTLVVSDVRELGPLLVKGRVS